MSILVCEGALKTHCHVYSTGPRMNLLLGKSRHSIQYAPLGTISVVILLVDYIYLSTLDYSKNYSCNKTLFLRASKVWICIASISLVSV